MSLGDVDTDLFFRFLSLQPVLMGGVTVGHVVFTVIIRSFGVSYDQQLLDITLRQRRRQRQREMFNSLYLITHNINCAVERNPIKIPW